MKAIIHCLCKLCQDCVSSVVSMTGKLHDFPGVSINETMNYEFPPARKYFHNFFHNEFIPAPATVFSIGQPVELIGKQIACSL